MSKDNDIIITQKYGYAHRGPNRGVIRVWWVRVDGEGISISFPKVKKQTGKQLRKIRKKVNIYRNLSGDEARYYLYNEAKFRDNF